jgi:hypothetical protein
MTRLLNGVLQLHDGRDAGLLCRRIINCSRFAGQSSDHEELLTYLVEECWALSLRYEPGGSTRFSTYATNTLCKRLIDWPRSRYGRTRWVFRHRVYERPRVGLVSINGDVPNGSPMVETLPGGSLYDGEHRLADEHRLLDERGRRPGWRDDWLGDEAA